MERKIKVVNVRIEENLTEIFLVFLQLSNNLEYYSHIKFSVDGDRLQVFWITQHLKHFRKKCKRKEYSFKIDRSHGNIMSR